MMRLGAVGNRKENLKGLENKNSLLTWLLVPELYEYPLPEGMLAMGIAMGLLIFCR